jgi:squalene cyclase
MTEVSIALERGVGFLLASQGDDGLWRDFLTPAGEASEWTTGFVATALHTAGADADALVRAGAALIERQNDDGGWGYHEEVPSDADSTACVLLLLERLKADDDVCRRAAGLLLAHQGESGGVATYREPGPIRTYMGVGRWLRFRGWCSPHTEVTATAGRALDRIAPDAARAAWDYVRPLQGADGNWRPYWWISSHYPTLQAVALADSLGEREPTLRACEWVAGRRQKDGAFATALSLSILLHAQAPRVCVERLASWLAILQDGDGGWPSEPIMRIPLPGDVDPDRLRLVRIGGPGIVVGDQHRTFTSAACVAALAHATRSIDTLPYRY